MARAVDVVRRVAPKARPSYLAAFENGDALLIARGLITPDRMAHFLAQVLHECGALTLEWESMNYGARRLLQIFGAGRHSASLTPGEARALARKQEAIAERVYGLGNPGKAHALGNTLQGDGFRYRGGGLLQTTGRENYRRMGERCGVNFEALPELIVSAEHALKPALAEWAESNLNLFADCNDILSISRAINIGNPRTRHIPNGMQDRIAWFAKIRPLIDRVEFLETAPRPQPQPLPAQPPEAGVTLTKIADIVADRIWRFGDEDGVVAAIQRALAQLGYDLKGTGTYGINTQTSVADFQARHFLEVDGEVGPETAEAIDAALARVPGMAQDADEAPQAPARATRPSPPATSPMQPTLSALIGEDTLQSGSKGERVRALQHALARLGYDLRGTGYYGFNTERAVTNFQTRHGLEVDGEAGPETAKAIEAALTRPGNGSRIPQDADGGRPSSPTQPSTTPPAAPTLSALLGDEILRIGSEGDLVRALQLALAKLGYDLTGTGTFGGATDTAVTHFQQSRGLEVDGEVGPQTAAAIDAAIAGGDGRGAPTVPTAPVDEAGRPIWLIEGLRWIDTGEGPGAANNPDILRWAREEGGAIARSYKHDSIPWCALYANMVLTKVGLQGTETLWALDWSNWGARLAGPAVGAFAPMKRDGGGHIAIVVGRDQHGNLMCLGGNQSDAVNIKPFPANRPLSFRWPKGAAPPPSADVHSLPLVKSDGHLSTREA